MNPKVTVLMPVFNGEKYLKEAIDSILNQTFKDFEFLIINDGSTDDSRLIIESYNDPRIRLIDKENEGLSVALNVGINLALGEYIARMDADDISVNSRLEIQVGFLNKHLDVGVCGSWAIMIDRCGKFVKKAVYPLNNEDIKAELLFNSPFAHPSVMFRKSVLEVNNLRYYPDLAEDYELWIRLSKVCVLSNLPKYLIKYRVGVGASSNALKQKCEKCANDIIKKQVLSLLHDVSNYELEVYCLIDNYFNIPDESFIETIFILFNKIKIANASKGVYNIFSLDFVIAREWFFCLQEVLEKRFFTLYKILAAFFYFFYAFKFLL